MIRATCQAHTNLFVIWVWSGAFMGHQWVFLPARSARSSEGVSLFFFFLARRLVKIEKLCFLVHGKFIICFGRSLGVFVNFTIPKPLVVSLL